MFDDGSHVQFLCSQCKTELTKLSKDIDHNSNSSKSHSSKKSLIDNAEGENIPNIQISLEKYNDEIVTRLEKVIDNKLTQALSKFNEKEFDSSIINNILSEVTKTAHLLPRVASADLVKETASNICSAISSKLGNKSQNTNQSKSSSSLLNKAFLQAASDPLFEYSNLNDSTISTDSCDGRPSVIFKQTVDDSILEIMRSSEDITWKTLDIIHNKVKENGETLNSIKDHVLNIESLRGAANDQINVRSPLVETVFHDAIDQLTSDITHIKETLLNHTPADIQTSAPTLTTPNKANSSGNPVGMTIISTDLTSSADGLESGMMKAHLNSEQMAGGNPIGMRVESMNSTSSAVGPESGPTHEGDHSIGASCSESEVLRIIEQMDQQSQPVRVQTMSNPSTLEDNPTNDSLHRKHEFHLSNIDRTITTNMVIDYLKRNGIDDLSNTNISRLVARGRDPSTLSFISFKIDTDQEIASIISRTNFWPPRCKLNKFVHKNQNQNQAITAVFPCEAALTTSDHFLSKRVDRNPIVK